MLRPAQTAIKHTLRYPPSAMFVAEEYRVGDHIKTDNIYIKLARTRNAILKLCQALFRDWFAVSRHNCFTKTEITKMDK